jgi:hypothetical protein
MSGIERGLQAAQRVRLNYHVCRRVRAARDERSAQILERTLLNWMLDGLVHARDRECDWGWDWAWTGGRWSFLVGTFAHDRQRGGWAPSGHFPARADDRLRCWETVDATDERAWRRAVPLVFGDAFDADYLYAPASHQRPSTRYYRLTAERDEYDRGEFEAALKEQLVDTELPAVPEMHTVGGTVHRVVQ